MDPSAELCRLYDSFSEYAPLLIEDPAYTYTSNPDDLHVTPAFTTVSTNANPPPQYCNSTRYDVLQRVKDKFDTPGFVAARDATNPFEAIGRSIFMNRAAIKLANIDAVEHITPEIFTFQAQTSNKDFTFCDVAAGPGGFTQYLQYRFPRAQGYGMTLKHETLDWNTRLLDMKRFTPFYGADKTGDLYTNASAFVEFVLQKSPSGVDLVTADGGFDLEDFADKTLLHRQEFLSSRLLLTQALVGIGCTKRGGNFVVKVFDTVTKISAHILYILALCFEKIKIFKPVSSRPANAERYVICTHRNFDVHAWYELLESASRAYTHTLFLESLFEDMLPQRFIDWLVQSNSRSIDLQLATAQNILLYLARQNPVIAKYNISKFLLIWNLPDTPPRRPRVK